MVEKSRRATLRPWVAVRDDPRVTATLPRPAEEVDAIPNDDDRIRRLDTFLVSEDAETIKLSMEEQRHIVEPTASSGRGKH